jgi:GNAT superfamily N-acetyltransferase
MLRDNLEDIPVCAFPAGFSLRWYQPGDEARWFRIHRLADHDSEITPDLFARRFGSDHDLLAQRQCYLLDGRGDPIGTATAWFDDDFLGARFGRVHYVAIVPDYQGRGLSRPLMSVICQRLRELGHDRAYLATSTARIPAINLYLGFGFVPLIRTEEEAAAWRGICPRHATGTPSLPACHPAQTSQ